MSRKRRSIGFLSDSRDERRGRALIAGELIRNFFERVERSWGAVHQGVDGRLDESGRGDLCAVCARRGRGRSRRSGKRRACHGRFTFDRRLKFC